MLVIVTIISCNEGITVKKPAIIAAIPKYLIMKAALFILI
jgi:hypothetical protein